MKQITEIKKIGKGDRYKLYLNEEFVGIYEAEILAKHCLKTGDSFSQEFFDNLEIENGDYACFNRGLNALEKSMKSEKMLIEYLRDKGYPKQCINKAVDKLKDYGYIDDKVYVENYLLTYQNSKSKKRIKYDLISKGIKENIIDEKLNNLDNEEETIKCIKFGQKYMKGKSFDLKNKQKFYNHLAYKGFGYEDIARAWEELNKE